MGAMPSTDRCPGAAARVRRGPSSRVALLIATLGLPVTNGVAQEVPLDPEPRARSTVVQRAGDHAPAAPSLLAQTPTPAAAPSLVAQAPAPAAAPLGRGGGETIRWSGWLQGDTAYSWPATGHFTHARTRGEVAGQGIVPGTGLKWRVSARGWYDAAYGQSDHYPPAVRRDQRDQLALHEAYVDFSRGNWEFRLGKQNIIWGEMVGLFFADVVSAKDLREFILPEFDLVRIPQWAARAEWFSGDHHLEFIWLPSAGVDKLGKPGSEFNPMPGAGVQVYDPRKPSGDGFGMRASTLLRGWDMAAFVYRAPDTQPVYARVGGTGMAADPFILQPRHDMLTRFGATVSQDFDGIVIKSELVYSRGRKFAMNPRYAMGGDGVVALDTVDWVVGVDATPWTGWRIDGQVFQRAFLDRDERTGFRRTENGASLLISHAINDRLDAEFLGLTSLTYRDRLLRGMLSWRASSNIRVRAGVDIFAGDERGMFGRYGNRDRVWAELRYTF